MKLKTIRASAGCTIPHPHQSYANIKLFVELTAELTLRENHLTASRELQVVVDQLLTTERERRLQEIEREYQEERARRDAERKKMQAINEAEQQIREAERKLELLKSGETEDAEEIPF